jgi:Tfp pilus assembly protein PilF
MTNFASAQALAGRAKVYGALGQSDNAIAEYRKALAFQPNMRGAKEALTRLGVAP